MGLTISNLLGKIFAKKQLRILMLGLDGAGKTTILYKLKLGEAVSTIPTVGFNVENVDYGNICFTVWDIGGQDKIRHLWRHYFQNTEAIIFVVDSSDRDRIEQAGNELRNILQDDELQNVLVLVLANKQDLPIAMTVTEVTEKMRLYELSNRKWHIEGICALRGNGLYNGMEWLSKELMK